MLEAEKGVAGFSSDAFLDEEEQEEEEAVAEEGNSFTYEQVTMQTTTTTTATRRQQAPPPVHHEATPSGDAPPPPPPPQPLQPPGNDWTNSDTKIVTEILGKQKCLKMARDFNRETACYCRLVVDLGGACDAPLIRDELCRCRRRALDLAQRNMAVLLPHLRGRIHEKGELEQYEKLWSDYASCLELLQQQLSATLRILRRFPINLLGGCSAMLLIRTGIIESVATTTTFSGTTAPPSHAPPHAPHAPPPHASAIVAPGPFSTADASADSCLHECISLERDICDVAKVLTDIRNLVYLKPWDMEPELSRSSDLVHANSEGFGLVTVFRRRLKSKRFMCLTVIVVCIAILVVISVVLALRL